MNYFPAEDVGLVIQHTQEIREENTVGKISLPLGGQKRHLSKGRASSRILKLMRHTVALVSVHRVNTSSSQLFMILSFAWVVFGRSVKVTRTNSLR